MLGTECVFGDRHCALVERPRSRKVALGLKYVAELVKARPRGGMLRAKCLFPHGQYIANKGAAWE
jgi:hypothetical protein